jgi:hypothetical protein
MTDEVRLADGKLEQFFARVAILTTFKCFAFAISSTQLSMLVKSAGMENTFVLFCFLVIDFQLTKAFSFRFYVE